MRTKFTFLLSTALIMGGHLSAFADTTLLTEANGWTKVTSISQSDIDNNYYVFVDNAEDLMLGLAESSTQGNTSMFYQKGIDFKNNIDYHKLWTLEKNGDNYSIRNVLTTYRLMQTEYSNSQNDLRWRSNDQSNSCSWTGVSLTYSDEDKAWTLTSTQYNRPLGIYNNGTDAPEEGSEIGANDEGKGTKFQIYAISKEAFAKSLQEAASSENPVDVTYLMKDATLDQGATGWTRTGGRSDWMNNINYGTWGAELYRANGRTEDYITLSQSLTNLPNGTYRFSVQLMSDDTDGGVKIYAGNEEIGTEYKNQQSESGSSPMEKSINYLREHRDYARVSVEAVVVDGTLTIGLKETNKNSHWYVFDEFKLEYLGQASSDAALKAAQTEFKTLQKKASNDYLNNSAYEVVGGNDKSNLQDLVNKNIDEVTVDNFESLKKEINDAMDAFKADVEIYRNFDKHIDVANLFGAEALGIEIPSKDLKETATGEVLRTKRNEVYMAIYNYVENNYKKDVTSVLEAGLDAWDKPGFTLTNDNWQSYRGNRTGDERYHEVNGGYNNQSVWSHTLTKNIEGLLPGKYVVKVACRTSQNGGNSAGVISAKVGEADAVTVQFPLKDDTGHGIATDGSACFDNSKSYNNVNRDGGGWEWKYVPFEVTTPSDVTLSITLSSEGGQNYPGFYDPQILTITQDVALNHEKDYEPTALSANVTLTRPMNQGRWNTIVLPFSVTAEQVKSQFGEEAIVASYTGNTGNTLNFKTETEGMQANVPYMVKPSTTAPEAGYKFDDVIMVKANEATSGEGTIKFVGNYKNGVQLTTNNYFISSSGTETIFYQAGGNETMKAYRATFQAANAATESKVLNFSLDGSGTTGIADIDAASKADAYNVYNLNGMLVKKNAASLEGLAKGIYIVNGKKYIVE